MQNKSVDYIVRECVLESKKCFAEKNNLEPDILESEVKWALESITTNKATGGDGIHLSYFKF